VNRPFERLQAYLNNFQVDLLRASITPAAFYGPQGCGRRPSICLGNLMAKVVMVVADG